MKERDCNRKAPGKRQRQGRLPRIALKVMFQVTQVTQVVRFSLDRGLRFRNLDLLGHDQILGSDHSNHFY